MPEFRALPPLPLYFLRPRQGCSWVQACLHQGHQRERLPTARSQEVRNLASAQTLFHPVFPAEVIAFVALSQ